LLGCQCGDADPHVELAQQRDDAPPTLGTPWQSRGVRRNVLMGS
jgi:hypothetical protein